MSKGLIAGIAVLAVVLILFFMGVGKYNSLMRAEESIDGAWSQVENQYQRRFDLIPNLVETVKGYADFEKETLLGVTEARARAMGAMANTNGGRNLEGFQEADRGYGVAMGRFFGYTETYPDLKANKNFLELQAQLEGTENRISVERKRFNESVGDYNTYIKQFPRVIYAGWFDFEKKGYFEAVKGAEQAPAVNF